MNIFNTKSGILGEAQIKHLNNTLTEFFRQALEIRSRLGKQSYLLDKYISSLLKQRTKPLP